MTRGPISVVILLLILTQGATFSPISSACRAKVAQVLCSIHYHEQLRLCLDGVHEGAIVKNEDIDSYCFTEEPEKCVTQKLCSVALKEDKQSTTTTPEPKVSPPTTTTTTTTTTAAETTTAKRRTATPSTALNIHSIISEANMDETNSHGDGKKEDHSEATSDSNDLYIQMLSNGWFWITLLVILALLVQGSYLLWLQGQFQALKATGMGMKPFIRPDPEQPTVEPVVQEQPPATSTASMKKTASIKKRKHLPLVSALPLLSEDRSMTSHCAGPCPPCSNNCLICMNSQPSPAHDSTYQPLQRVNSFRSGLAYTERDKQDLGMMIQETSKLLQAQMKRMKDMEANVNKKPSSQPLSEFEEHTGWIYQQGAPMFQEGVNNQAAAAAAAAHNQAAHNQAVVMLNQAATAGRPPIPPPPPSRQDQAIPMQDIHQRIVPIEIH